MSSAIEIKNLTKQFTIKKDGRRQSFTALDGLNLEVEKGSILGLIGHNGAGKSTLLKILSRITYPTSGEVLLRGKLSSLLEVGTGFHPELSGKENIFLNGSILGMKRPEIRAKLEEIIEFSGVSDFIDTPVKHYSSGMYVRLAFSVAAFLTPDILLIDEVLAVGDTAFQQKCLKKVEESSSDEGRTVIFVSHNMSAVRQLCEKVAWLDKGKLKQLGPAEEVTAAYLKSMENLSQNLPLEQRTDRKGNGEVIIKSLEWQTPNDLLISGGPARLIIRIKTSGEQPIGALNFRLNIFKHNGEYLGSLSNESFGHPISEITPETVISCQFDALPLNEGRYFFNANLYHNSQKADRVDRALDFKVAAGDNSQAGANINLVKEGARLPQHWTTSV